MNRVLSCGRSYQPLFFHQATALSRSFSAAPSLGARQSPDDDNETIQARVWLSQLSSKTIPRHICEISFSRSGGPGGQNVNKFDYLAVNYSLTNNMYNRINSKATLKVPIASLFATVPRPLHAEIKKSRYFAARAECLVIQSDESRKQSQNVETCYDKLQQLIAGAGKAAVPGETSVEQKRRVRYL